MTPETFAAKTGASRETLERLKAFDALLVERAAIHNLVSRSTLPDRWERHFYDSAQLIDRIPKSAKEILDLGSGAGFPGLVIAAFLVDRDGSVTLVESKEKKCVFLRDAVAAMGLKNVRIESARVESGRLESVCLARPPDLVTARALAPLPKLFSYVSEIRAENARLLFPKGARADEELTNARKSWRFQVVRHASVTDPAATILEITALARRK
ncbi:MAG: 16S rRNA (guanine(527)-N(7))-methyltransferase RsmG [Pseudomonadota bacterium]